MFVVGEYKGTCLLLVDSGQGGPSTSCCCEIKTKTALDMLNTKLSPTDFRYQKEVEVRFRDTDQVGHVNNAVYSSYLELARISYAHALGFDLKDGDGFSFMLIETQVRFMAPAMFGDVITVHARISEMKRMQFTFEYIITRNGDDQRLCAARSLQVGLDTVKERARSLHPQFVEKVKEFEGDWLS